MYKMYVKLLLFFLAISSALSSAITYDLALTAIFRDEAPYLREWIEFHKLVGVKHFYLYNNQSQDNYLEVLSPYILNGEVELFDWGFASSEISQWGKIQCDAYDDAIGRTRGVVKWLAILDTDEFLFPTEGDSLVQFLEGFDKFAVVSANWQMFGTSGVSKIPQGLLLIETLVMRAPVHYGENKHVKSIVRPARVTSSHPHFCHVKPDFEQVDASKRPFHGPVTSSVDVSKLRVNHYWTRDEAFFYNVKMARRQGWGEKRGNIMTRLTTLNVERDEAILRFVPQLKTKIAGLDNPGATAEE